MLSPSEDRERGIYARRPIQCVSCLQTGIGRKRDNAVNLVEIPVESVLTRVITSCPCGWIDKREGIDLSKSDIDLEYAA